MKVEIRPATTEEMTEYTRIAATALGVPSEGAWSIEFPEQTLCAFENGKIATTYRAHNFIVYFNGKDVPVAGIADIGTLPIYRRRGYLRQIVTTHFKQMHEQGERSIAILWPSNGAIYRRYGYAFVTMQYSYRIEPRYLRFAEPMRAEGSFSEIGEQDVDSVADLYHKFATVRTGYLHRSRKRWESAMLGPPPKGTLVIRVLYVERGTPLGYLAYTVESEGPGFPNQRVRIREMVYLNLSAYRAIWEYLTGMDLIGTITLPDVPQDYPLPHLLLDPRVFTPISSNGLMGRIVDVARALPQRGYQKEGQLIFEIRDELCAWNQGCWEMDVSNGVAIVKRSRKSPQVTMPVSTLALLVLNYVNASMAERAGQLDVLELKALAVWDEVMRTTYPPFCTDHF